MSRIKELRQEKGWKQDYLGQLLNVKNSAISKYENGKVPITAETIIKLAEIFDVTTDYLLGISSNRHNTNASGGETQLTNDERRILSYYRRLDDENKDVAKGTLVSLYKEQESES